MLALTVTPSRSSRAQKLKPAPPGFAEVFIRWGWRGVETVYGSRTECNKRWLSECGGAAVVQQRQAYMARLGEVKRARSA